MPYIYMKPSPEMKRSPKKIQAQVKKLNIILNITHIHSLFYKDIPKNYVDMPEAHDFWELVYVDSGSATLIADDVCHTLKKGDAFLHRPNEPHYFSGYADGGTSIFICSFTTPSKALYLFKDYQFTLDDNCKLILSRLLDEVLNSSRVFSNAQYLHRFRLNGTSYDDHNGTMQCIKCYLELLFINLLRLENGTQQKLSHFVSQSNYHNMICNDVTSYLFEHIYENVTLEGICADLHCGKTMLCNQFKKHTGKSVMQYFTELKIEEAKKLLRHNEHNISQISEMLQFSTQFYFSRVFKQHCGVSPTDYKTSLKNI